MGDYYQRRRDDDDDDEGQRRPDGIPLVIRVPTPERERGAADVLGNAHHDDRHDHHQQHHPHNSSSDHTLLSARHPNGSTRSRGGSDNDQRPASLAIPAQQPLQLPPSYSRHSEVATAHQRTKALGTAKIGTAHGYHAQQQQQVRQLRERQLQNRLQKERERQREQAPQPQQQSQLQQQRLHVQQQQRQPMQRQPQPQRSRLEQEIIELLDSSDEEDIPPPVVFSPPSRPATNSAPAAHPINNDNGTENSTNNGAGGGGSPSSIAARALEGQRFASVEAARAAAAAARRAFELSTATRAAAAKPTGKPTNVRPPAHGGTVVVRLPQRATTKGATATRVVAKKSVSPQKQLQQGQHQPSTKPPPLVIMLDDSSDDDGCHEDNNNHNNNTNGPAASFALAAAGDNGSLSSSNFDERQLLESLERDISKAEQMQVVHEAAQAAATATMAAAQASSVNGGRVNNNSNHGPPRASAADSDSDKKPAAIPRSQLKQVARKTPGPRFSRSHSDSEDDDDYDDDDDDSWSPGERRARGQAFASRKRAESGTPAAGPSSEVAHAPSHDVPLITSDDDDGEPDHHSPPSADQKQQAACNIENRSVEQSTCQFLQIQKQQVSIHPLSPQAQQTTMTYRGHPTGQGMSAVMNGVSSCGGQSQHNMQQEPMQLQMQQYAAPAIKRQKLDAFRAASTTPSQSPVRPRRQRNRKQPERLLYELMAVPSPVAVRHADRDEFDLEVMDTVKHLTTKVISPSGLPSERFTCFSASNADVIYDFQVDIGPSNIPNAGNGAFLTFLGARTLRPGVREFKTRSGESPKIPLLDDEDLSRRPDGLQAVGRDGLGITLSIVENATRFIDSTCMFVESDYESSPETCFSSLAQHNGLLDLGRYGPFRKIDRKPEINFSCKNFIFSNEPAEWAFGVEEKILGWEQMIDITDDTTGKTHDLAIQNLPMHVNEVGHNKSLTQNVFSRESHDRTVRYYIKIKDPMARGQRVELLVDYYGIYEEVRERKGYGLKNLQEGLPNDDDTTMRFERNFDLRTMLDERINDKEQDSSGCFKFHFLHFYDLLEFLEYSIRRPISDLADRFLDGGDEGPTCMQWIALVRIEWLGTLLEKKLDFFESCAESQGNRNFPYAQMFAQCRGWIGKTVWTSFGRFVDLSQSITDCEGRNIRDAVRVEFSEQMCFQLKREIQAPFHPGIWCPVARKLKMELSWLDTTNITSEKSGLWNKLLALAKSAAADIRKAAANIEDDSECLEFARVVDASTRLGFRDTDRMFDDLTRHNLNVDKCRLASLCDMKGYADAMALAGEQPLVSNDFTLLPKTRALVTKFDGFQPKSGLSSLPMSVEDCIKRSCVVNDTWYIAWQVVYIVHAFAEEYLPEDAFTLEELCSAVNVDVPAAQHAIERMIEGGCVVRETGQVTSPAKKTAPSKGTGKGAETAKATSSKAAKEMPSSPGETRKPRKCVYSGPPTEPLVGGWPSGWIKTEVERQGGTCKGTRDRYWHTPKTKFKLRSMTEVHKFMSCMEDVGDDDPRAVALFKAKNS